ncbi:MAG: tyrosine-type recombinase/integrase [Betaproteobacteria bacterium]|nr:MAG: tyrosine-type recombinase/integrase [Betaproteobacteria bacterium]
MAAKIPAATICGKCGSSSGAVAIGGGMRIRSGNAHFANNQRTIQNNQALEAAFRRAGVTDVFSHNLRKTFATRLLSRGAAITDVQHLLGHASVKTTEKAYAAFVKNERFKQTIDLLDEPKRPRLKLVSLCVS